MAVENPNAISFFIIFLPIISFELCALLVDACGLANIASQNDTLLLIYVNDEKKYQIK